MCMYGREFGGEQYQRFCPPPTTGLGKWGRLCLSLPPPILLPHICMHTIPPLSQMHIRTYAHTSHTHSTHLHTHTHAHTHTHIHSLAHSDTHAHAHTTLTIFKVGRQFTPPQTHTLSIDPSTSPTKSLPGGGNELCGIHVAIVVSGHKIG